MKNIRLVYFVLGWLFLLSYSDSTLAQRQMEDLGRGVVAVRTGTNSAFVSWRLLGTESNTIGFNLYRSTNGGAAVKVNNSVLSAGTNYSDNALNATANNAYFVKPVIDGVEQEASASYTLKANQIAEPCFVVPLKQGSEIHFVWVGDLDGDGEFDYVVDRLDWSNGNQKIEAYKNDGTFLWDVDFGTDLNTNNISPGPSVIDVGNWDGVTVFDLDGDGVSEVIIKSADGVTFGDAQKLTHSNKTVQFISILDGKTGAERARAQIPNDYISSVGPWACSLGIGYLNGVTPSVVGFFKSRNADKSFNRLQAAWNFDGTNLNQEWAVKPYGASYSAHGADGHQMRIMDFDSDGKDEIGHVAFTLNGEDGSLMYDLGNDGVVHGDRWHVGKLDPYRPGLQGYGVQQDQSEGLIEYYYDAGTGKVLWKHSGVDIVDIGRGEAGDIDPRHPGYEVWSFNGQYNGPSNKRLSNSNPYPNFRIWWDGDLLSENLNDSKLEKWNYASQSVSRVLTIYKFHGATGSARAAPLFYGDIMGDWREEMIYATNDYSGLVVFTTDIPTNKRIYTLPHNPEYRMSMTVKGYMQSHMVDYYLGAEMMTPPTPAIQSAKCIWSGDGAENVWDESTSNWNVNGTTGTYTQGDDVMFDLTGTPNTDVAINGTITPASVKVITGLDYTFEGTGTISGITGMLKSGEGDLTFNCDMSYTDSTRVEQGALYVNGQIDQSPLTVYMGATLGGKGTISQPVKLHRGCYVTLGEKDSIGTLTFENGLLLPKRSTVIFDITNDATGSIKPSDKIVVNGDLSISKEMTFVCHAIDGEILAGSYPLIAYTGTFSGDLSEITIEGLFGRKIELQNTSNTITLKIYDVRSASTVVWSGSETPVWDLQTTENWVSEGNKAEFVTGDTVVFDETGSAVSTITIVGDLPVGQMVFNGDDSNFRLVGNGVIGGTGDLVKNGNGEARLTVSNNIYTGKTIINSGTLIAEKLAIAGEPSSIGANTSTSPTQLVINNATFSYKSSSNSNTDKGILLNGANNTINIDRSNSTLSTSGIIQGNGKLIKTGAGTLHLTNNNNSYKGGTIIKEGTIQLNDPGSYSRVGALGSGNIVIERGTLATGNTSSGTGFNYNINVPEGGEGTFFADARCTYDGKLTGSGTLNIVLPGSIDRTVWRGNWSEFAGTVGVSGTAPMRLANNSGYGKTTFDLASGMSMYFSAGTTGGDATASNVYIGGISGATDSYLDGENWHIGGANGTIEFKGVIRGNSINKVGEGTLILSNANTYSGGTKITSGKLIANNSAGSATGNGKVTILENGTLDGTGTINGAIVVNSGGTLEFGEELGTMTVNNTVTMNADSYMKVDLNSSMGSSDKLNTGTKSLTLNGTLVINNTSLTDYYAGSRFTLFTGSKITGEFAEISPETPGDGLVWDTSSLYDYGILKIKMATSVDDTDASTAFNIYPNPVKDKLHIQLNENMAIELVVIRSATGNICMKTRPNANGTIDISHLSDGIYMLEILTNDQKLSEKIVKF